MSSTASPSSSTSISPPTSPDVQPPECADDISQCTMIYVDEKNSFEVGQELGTGSFGKVFQVLHLNLDRNFAMKAVYLNTQKQLKCAEKEAQMMRRLIEAKAHLDHIVRCHAIFHFQNHLCLVMEKLQIDLFNYMANVRHYRPFRLNEVQNFGKQLTVAIKRLHSMGIAHTDIKTENIMIVDVHSPEPVIKLIDFGLALDFEELKNRKWASLQTVCYRAPEVVFGLPLSQTIDCWSIGCILVELYVGCTFYPADNNYNLIKMILRTQSLPDAVEDGAYSAKYLERVTKKDSKGGSRRLLALKRPSACAEQGIEVVQETKQNYPLRSLNSIIRFGFNQIMCDVITPADRMLLDVVVALMNVNADQRPSAEDTLKMPFFNTQIVNPTAPSRGEIQAKRARLAV